MRARPNFEQLKYFANLINGKDQNPLSSLDINDDDLLETLDYHGITMLALRAGKLSNATQQRLASRKAMMAANELLKQKAITELFSAFEQAGLSNSILFKGSALAYTIYSQPWLRPRSDSDCLIDHNDYPGFTQVLEKLGYQKQFAIEGKHISYQNSFSKKLVGQVNMNIDLHWRINNRQTLANSFDVHELIKESQSLSVLSNAIKIPSTVDSLLIASLHRLGHHQNEERLTWLHDIHLLASELTQSEWQQLCDKADYKKIAGITLDALQYCQSLLDTKIPSFAVSALEIHAREKEPSQVFLNRELPEWKIFLYDLRGLKGWQNKLRLIIENFFPNPDYIRQKMNTNNIMVAYLRRITRGLRRITR